MEDREKKRRITSDQMDSSVRRRQAADAQSQRRRPQELGGRTRTASEREMGSRTRTASEREMGSRTRTASEREAGSRTRTAPEREMGSRTRTAPGREAGSRTRTMSERERVQRRREAMNAENRRPASRKAQLRRRRKRNLGLKISFLIILLILVAAVVFLWRHFSPSKEKADRNEYYGIKKENQMAVIINNQVMEPQGMIEDGKAYLQYELVKEHLNSRFYWDPNENVLLYTLPRDTVSVGVGSKEYTISKDKENVDYVILKTEGSTAYIAVDFVQQYTNIDFAVYSDPDRIMIVNDWGETSVATVKKDTQVRWLAGIKSDILTEVSKKAEVTVIEDEGDWKKIRTEDGFIGYVKKNTLKKEQTTTISREFEQPEYTSIKKDYTINMAWHNVTNTYANDTVLQMIAQSKGLTTISPTWFHVQDTEGNIESIASADYVNYAHQSNVEVWAAIRDFDGGIGSFEESLELLSRTSRRENLINQLIAEALQVGVDGINVDFEMISDECGDHYIQFIRELSVRCRQNSLVLSIDNYVPKGFNMQYNREEQGNVADYVVIMGYDEYYGGSPVAGPVSSYNYVKEGIEETLKEVPAEKVISGIPFYTRLWMETPKTEQELAEQQGTDEAEYAANVTSEACDMYDARAKVDTAGAEIVWDDEAKQNFSTWTSDGVTYKIWLEDAQSIEPKLKLMKDNKLAGTAAWALGLEDTEIWQLIQQYTN